MRSREELRNKYRGWSTEDLQRIVAESQDYRPEAVEVVRDILANRDPAELETSSEVAMAEQARDPVRIVVFFNIGPPFAGFRAAGRPGMLGLDNAAAFEALEHAIQKAFVLLRAHPPSAWQELAAGDSFRATIPRFENREGVIDVTGDATHDEAGDVVLRAFIPFSLWPLGGWAVYEAWHLGTDGVWTPLSHEELATLW